MMNQATKDGIKGLGNPKILPKVWYTLFSTNLNPNSSMKSVYEKRKLSLYIEL